MKKRIETALDMMATAEDALRTLVKPKGGRIINEDKLLATAREALTQALQTLKPEG